MEKQTLIFMGRSGSGKGTQADLLAEYLEKNDSRKIFRVESGAQFRELFAGDSFTSKIANEINNAGGLQPEFLSIAIWSNDMLRNLEEDSHIVLDGTARKLLEAQAMKGAFDFYKRQNVIVIDLEVPRDEAKKRLLLRERNDDNEELIDKRLEWFETDVVPVLEYFDNDPDVTYMKVNGVGAVEDIHKDIVNKLGI